MNRQQRRASARATRREHANCGCVERILIPANGWDTILCPECDSPGVGWVYGPDGEPLLMLPIASAVGTLKDVEYGCSCGHEWTVTCAVVE